MSGNDEEGLDVTIVKKVVIEDKEVLQDDAPSDINAEEMSPLQAIYAKADKANHPNKGGLPKKEDSEEEDLDEEPPVEDPEDLTIDENLDEDDPEESDEPDEPIPPVKEEDTVAVKVNGRERQVSKAKVDKHGGVENYQKMVAANDRLQKAAEAQKGLDARESELAAREAAFENKKTLPLDKSDDKDLPIGDQPTGDRRNSVIKALDTALDGDVEDAADALIKALDNPGLQHTESFDPDEIADRAVQKVKMDNFNQQVSQAKEDFKIDFPELVADTMLWDLADRETNNIMKENPTWSPSEILTEAGNRVVSRFQAPEVSDDTDPMAERKAEKQSIRKPKVGSGKSERRPEPRTTQTRSEYVQEQRRLRGLD